MKKLLFLLIQTVLFASLPNEALLSYQKKYSMCKGKTDYLISYCLLNGNLNFSQLHGDRYAFRSIRSSKIKQAVAQGNVYEFTMDHLPKTERYLGLKHYIDHLYTEKKNYTPPQFKGNEEEDTLRMKRVFNILQDAGLEENSLRDEAFERALREYQRRHSLEMDGKIGPRTKLSLKEPLNNIIVKVKKNMVWQSLVRKKGPTYVLVNIAAFKMHFYENYQPELSMKVIVGKPKKRTPVFNRKIQYIVKNPRWNVPSSIYHKEYAGKSAAYLKKKGFAFNSEGKLYQKSGNRNALGLVKFLFPNKYNVYMHDTPSKGLFSRTTRAYSHGCIRLEKPMSLLHTLGYNYQAGKTTWITLKKTIPVFVEYHTAWVNDEGKVMFANDIYGYEKKLFSKPVYMPKRSAKKRVKKQDVTSIF